MATLTIRNLDEPVKQKLRVRAAHHGRSMEAEVKDILGQAVLNVQPAPLGLQTPNNPSGSVCAAVRGSWKGRMTTDEIMALTRGE